MFVGHYAVAFAIKAAAPKTPLWTTVAGCQLIDIAWSVFIMSGVEHASVDPSLPGSKLVLFDMPYTHSLPAALLWSAAWGGFAMALLRQTRWAALLIGFSVFSHWLLDLLVHRPDLELWFGDGKVGLGLWNYPAPEQALEIGLLAVMGMAWAASRKALGRSAWPATCFVGFLVALQIVAMLSPQPGGPLRAAAGATILAIYLVVVAGAVLADRRQRAKPAS
ncbi:MAG TPA: hypothetical protein VG841_00145 [Caulobacterales bacterium]|nr:hypothetical protein [Caulobacterales bacterium]